VLALAGAVLVLAVGIAVRRLRWPALAAALVIAWFAIPHLDLLLAEAYPTSFYHSTTGFAADSIAVGGRLYPENCRSCHGQAGKGDGPVAKTLSVPPADLTAGHLWGHSDGELFWWLSHGIEGPEGDALVMPGFAATLSEDERWNLIDFIRARNAGSAYAASGNWPAPIAAPGFSASCPVGSTSLASLHGKVVRIAFVGPGGTRLPPVPADAGVEVVTVIVALGGYVPPPGCAATDPAIAESYGLVAGVAPDALAGTQFLVDPDGWLRAMQRPGETVAAGWDDPAALLAEINQICRHPLAVSGGADVHHHHAE
jgi:mono/diheme cytochrome c family protein